MLKIVEEDLKVLIIGELLTSCLCVILTPHPLFMPHRSTPCPSVKLNDEWSDPAHCDRGDSCPYCHTRTEQQFHPEVMYIHQCYSKMTTLLCHHHQIYKSTKCNDIQQTGYCPRGPFCAFAHNDGKMITYDNPVTSHMCCSGELTESRTLTSEPMISTNSPGVSY